jgi:hypothetical protein
MMIVHSPGSVAVALDEENSLFQLLYRAEFRAINRCRDHDVRDIHAIARIRTCGSVLGREDKAERPGIEGRLNIIPKGTVH